MKLRSLLFALGLLVSAAGAHAQVDVYFNPIVTHVSISTPDTGIYAFLGQGNTSHNFGGISTGVSYTFLHDPKYAVAVDLRDELQHGNNALLNAFLFGVHVSGRPEARLQPYVQLAVGDGTTHSPLSPIRLSRAMFKGYVGADFRINRHLTFRALEVGYGTLSTISSQTYGGTTPIPSANMISFSSGLVVRFGAGKPTS